MYSIRTSSYNMLSVMVGGMKSAAREGQPSLTSAQLTNHCTKWMYLVDCQCPRVTEMVQHSHPIKHRKGVRGEGFKSCLTGMHF